MNIRVVFIMENIPKEIRVLLVLVLIRESQFVLQHSLNRNEYSTDSTDSFRVCGLLVTGWSSLAHWHWCYDVNWPRCYVEKYEEK